MTISMIPTGQPYGQRQATEAATQEAGLPVTASQTPPQAGPPPMLARPRAAGPISTPQPRARGTFDALASRTPSSVGQLRVDPDSRVLDLLAQSPSPVLQDLAARLRGF